MGTILLKRFYDYKPVRLNYSNLKLGGGGWVVVDGVLYIIQPL